MTAEGQVQVSSAVLDAGASDTDTIAGQIERELSELKSFLAPLVSTWEGEAASDWQALQTKWNTSAEDLHAVLQQIAAALRTASENYVSGENTNKSMWQG
jgi:early secretory antigenic target protein ESAT-6